MDYSEGLFASVRWKKARIGLLLWGTDKMKKRVLEYIMMGITLDLT